MWLETPKNLFGTTFATRIIFYVHGWYFLDPQNGNFYMKYSWNIFYPYGTCYIAVFARWSSKVLDHQGRKMDEIGI